MDHKNAIKHGKRGPLPDFHTTPSTPPQNNLKMIVHLWFTMNVFNKNLYHTWYFCYLRHLRTLNDLLKMNKKSTGHVLNNKAKVFSLSPKKISYFRFTYAQRQVIKNSLTFLWSLFCSQFFVSSAVSNLEVLIVRTSFDPILSLSALFCTNRITKQFTQDWLITIKIVSFTDWVVNWNSCYW